MPLTWVQLALLAAIVSCGTAVQTAIGFGSMVVNVTLGALFLPVDLLVPVLIPASLVQTSWVAFTDRSGIAWPLLLKRVLPLMLLGMLATLWVVPSGAGWLRPLLGVLILGLAVRELSRTVGAPPSPWVSNLGIVGAGIVHGLFATGGPPLVWALGREALDKRTFRASLTMIWLLLNLVLLGSLVLKGRLALPELQSATLLLPAVALGIAVGQALYHRVDEGSFRRGVWAVLAVAALPLILG